MKSSKPSGQCNNCNLIFEDEKEFNDHILLNYVNQEINYCNYNGCNRKLSSLNSLIRHVYTHSGYKPYICIECGQKFSTIGNLRRHERVVCPKNQILIESNNFEYQPKLKNNSISTKQDSNEETRSTKTNDDYNEKDIRNYATSLNFYLDRQKRERIDENPLDLSNKGNKKIKFDYGNEYDQNIIKPNYLLLHSSQKMLQKIFDRCLDNLFKNSILPLNESASESKNESENEFKNESANEFKNEFKNEFVNESLIKSTNESLIKSINEPLIQSTNKSANESLIKSSNEFTNESIDKSFILIDPFDENDYKLLESGLSKNYLCKVCKMKLRTTKSLSNHKLKHKNNIEPNKCNICDYSCYGSLERHLLKHNGEKKYKCKVCNQQSPYKANLIRHIVSLHKDMFNNKEELLELLIKPEEDAELNNISNPISNDDQNSLLNFISNTGQLNNSNDIIYQFFSNNKLINQSNEDQQSIENEQLNEDDQLNTDGQLNEDQQLIENEQLDGDQQLTQNEQLDRDQQLSNEQLDGDQQLSNEQLDRDQQLSNEQFLNKLNQILGSVESDLENSLI